MLAHNSTLSHWALGRLI